MPPLLFCLFFVLDSIGSDEGWAPGQPTMITDDPPILVQTWNGLKGHWEVYFRIRLPSVDMPVHKASSRIAVESIIKGWLFRHIGQTREALSPYQARGVLFCHTTCMYFALPSNMNDWMFGHNDVFINKGRWWPRRGEENRHLLRVKSQFSVPSR